MSAPGTETQARDAVRALGDALHALAQPLTAVAFLVEIGRLQSNADVWKSSLDAAVEECRRAMERLDTVRSAAAAVCSHVDGGAL